MQPLVSILIPAFNAERFIADTLRSAIAQSWPRKEILVVDDGSTDATSSVARRFDSAMVRLVRQENQGAAAARNTALSLAQGDYIQWLDADDLLSADKVASQMRLLREAEEPRMLASSGWAHFRFRPWKATFTPSPLWLDLAALEWMLRKWETNSHMQTATWLTSRQLAEEAGPWNTTLSNDDDGEYFSRVIVRSEGVRFAPDAKVYYRISPSSRLSYIGASDRKLDAMFRGMQLQIALLRSRCDDQRARDACTRYLEDWLPHFHPARPDIVEQARALTRSWGGELRMPVLSWKYSWLCPLLGLSGARAVERQYRETKSVAAAIWDGALLKAQGRTIDMASL